MSDLIKLDSIDQYCKMLKVPTLHPMVGVVDFSKSIMLENHLRMMFGFYAIMLKDVKCGDLHYGRQMYDYQEGTLVFFAPGQVLEIDRRDDAPITPKGLALVFHRDLLSKLPLARSINEYSFFSYKSNEALHLSDEERRIFMGCIDNIDGELHSDMDLHSRRLIVSNIELLLNYCRRFYDRQFATRSVVNTDLLSKLEGLVDDYFQTDKARNLGLPSVSYFADQLHLSSNYFGDLVKKEMGISPQAYIQQKLTDVAKEKVLDTSKSLLEVSYELGFEYSQHFSRWFKNTMGCTPREFRKAN